MPAIFMRCCGWGKGAAVSLIGPSLAFNAISDATNFAHITVIQKFRNLILLDIFAALQTISYKMSYNWDKHASRVRNRPSNLNPN